MDKKLVVANWKMLPESLAEAREILEFINDYLTSTPLASEDFSLVICPPFIFIEEVSKILKMSSLEDMSFLGAQDIALEEKSALTGEISGPMLSKLSVQYVIIGHSERRWKLGESDETVNKKLRVALKDEFVPIVCIGERERNENFKNALEQQIKGTFKGLSQEDIAKCLIAYEPVWAISTNPGARPDTPESALESINIIREFLNSEFNVSNPMFLYGGSVNSNNIGQFIKQKEISGVLVGGASVKKIEFVEMLKIVSQR